MENEDDYFWVMNFSDALSVCVTRELTWDGCQKPGARWLNLVFGALDKEALFFHALGVFDPAGSVGGRIPATEWNDGKRWEELWKKSQASLHNATQSLPMIRRFEAEYNDVAFSPEEVIQLRAECLSVRAKAPSAESKASLDKLLFACEEALQDDAGLFFASN